MDPARVLGWMVGAILIGLSCADWAMHRLLHRSVTLPVISRLTLPTRAGLACVGLLCVVGGNWYVSWRHAHELPFGEDSVAVTALAPGDSLFPIAVVVQNDFQRMTHVQLRCMVERFSTSTVDFLDADVAARVDVRVLDEGGSFRFECPAPRELKPPFSSADVRGAHMTVDVLFSVADRWRRLGVRRGFDLTVASGAASWKREPAVLIR